MVDMSERAIESIGIAVRILQKNGGEKAAGLFAGALVESVENAGDDPVEVMLELEKEAERG